MIRPPRSDFWNVGIVPTPIRSFLNPTVFTGRLAESVTWLPDPGPWRYLADPFGLRRPDGTHVFVEAYDYRTKHAVIEHHELSPSLEWRNKSTVLRAAHHLSYPYIVESMGEVFMIPECHRSGELVLYRARRFPRDWVRETVLLPKIPAAEASVVQHHDRWWMFFTIVGPNRRDQRELHLAYANHLTGPWTLHPGNPVRDDLSGARPGGTPFHDVDGSLVLPVQDCSRTYGGGIRQLRFEVLTPERIVITKRDPIITGDLFSSTHIEGCHTLSRCADLTLIDAKRIAHSWGRHRINLQRKLTRLLRIKA